jgi:hypothetical protein
MRQLLCLVLAGFALAQDASPPQAPAESKQEEAPEAEAKEGPADFEVEFVASDIFRSGSYLQPIWRGLVFEGDYFGGKQADVGFLAAAWTFRLRGLKVMPGFGMVFGTNQFTTSPAVSVRWDYERKWLVSQGLWVQGLRQTPIFGEEAERPSRPPKPVSFVRPMIWDGNHISGRWKRLTIGGTWERIEFREGTEWKGGGRLGVRLLPRISGILYVLGPGRAEWRGGIMVHARQGGSRK